MIWEWKSKLACLDEVTIPRCFKQNFTSEISSIQLHFYSDASEDGYGMCCYLRFLCRNGFIHVAFLMGKSRVTPQKEKRMPRLELTAAKISTEVYSVIKDELEYEIESVHFWTDSSSVLRWINNTKV